MLKLKDIVALGALAVIGFPVVLLGVLLWTGNVRLVFGPESQDPQARSHLLERPEDIPGATPIHGSDTGEGKEKSPEGANAASNGAKEGGNADQKEAEALREAFRLQDLIHQDERLRDTIRAERMRLEAILGKGDSLESQRTTVLAATFSSMKPDQAAKILSSLDDILVTAVLRKVPDDKPRAKILAAMGKLDSQRAGRISRLLAQAPVREPTKDPAKKSTPPEKPAPADTARKPTEPKTEASPSAPSPKKEEKTP